MVTIRIRSLMWFFAGATISIALAWSLSAWRAYALPGPTESTIVAITPTRILDTRDPTNLGLAGPFVSPVSQKLQVTGVIAVAGGAPTTVVPPGATGVLLNVTATQPSANGFVSVRPGDASGPPSTSSLNVTTGATVPNSVQVSMPSTGADAGKIDITFDALGTPGPTTDIIIDVVGYTTSAGIQDLVAQLAQKANASDLGAKANTNQLPIARSARENEVRAHTSALPVVAASVTIVAPVAGFVQLVGSTYISGISGPPSAAFANCKLTTGAAAVDFPAQIPDTFRAVSVNPPFSSTDCTTAGALPVAAGTTTFNLVVGGATEVDFESAVLNALFVPDGSVVAS